MRVSLFVSCLVDQLWPAAGVASVRVLRRAGVEVAFDPRQTCCGQPAFNTGYRAQARAVAAQVLRVFGDGDEPIVVPSGSCAAMLRRLPELFEDVAVEHARARSIAARTHELSAFLVRELGAVELGARFDGRVAWHDACHGLRDLGVRDEPRALLARVAGLELVELAAAEACCGFGGTFAVRYPDVSLAILERKLDELPALGVDAIASLDAGCLLQIEGRLRRTGSSVRALHLCEILAVADGERA